MPTQSERLMDVSIRRSFLLQSAEIYGAPAGFYDYGTVGCQIKHNLENLWRQEFLQKEGFHEIETSIVLPEAVLKASGHAQNFADPLVSCSSCKNKFRADHLIEGNKEAKKDGVKAAGMAPQELGELIKKYSIACPNCKKATLSEVGWFNMMFRTNIGPVDGNTAYLRPETAQGIFLDFARLARNFGGKLPIGIGQVGRSARNEISPRQGLIRMREFTQMELEYFFNPSDQKHPKFEKVKGESMRFADGLGETKEMTLEAAMASGLVANEIMGYFLYKQWKLYLSIGVPAHKMVLRKLPKGETPHYSLGNVDLEVETSYGPLETTGTAYRTDYDLSSHAKASGKDLSIFDEETKQRIIPHVVEPSMGVDRMFWCVLEHCFREKSSRGKDGSGDVKGKTEAGREEGSASAAGEKDWEWFDFPPAIAPYHAWVFPLMKKDGLDGKAREVEEKLRESGLNVYYQESGSIGRRYARADEIGVPYCITIDFDTLEKGDVTVRFRNDGKQIRVKIEKLAEKLSQFVKEGKVTEG